MIETQPLCKSTMTAFHLLQASFQRAANELAVDGLLDKGLNPVDGWRANLDTGLAERTVADPAAP